MLKELNIYLKSEEDEMLDDYWYDSALFVCEDILREFSDEEWEKLVEEIPNESVMWQKRLVECLGELKSPYELECILNIINTEDEDLFIICIDALRSMDISTLQDDIKKNIVKQVEELVEKESRPPAKKVLEDFLRSTV